MVWARVGGAVVVGWGRVRVVDVSSVGGGGVSWFFYF